MKIKIDHYTIHEKEDELFFEISALQVQGFPFLDTEAYVSMKRMNNGVFFITDKSQKNVIIFSGMTLVDLHKIKNQKKILLALIKDDGLYDMIYSFDVFNIK